MEGWRMIQGWYIYIYIDAPAILKELYVNGFFSHPEEDH